MSCCKHCLDSESLFSARTARRELRRYRRRGASTTTRLLVEAIRHAAPGATLLDIGGGIGAVQHELFAGGLARAIQVDASHAYLERSAEEARRRGHGDRVTYRYGDYVAVAAELTATDIVTLDRVICCYPDVDRLVTRSAASATRLYGLVFPRARTLTRLGIWLGNSYFRLRRRAFRGYLHPAERVEDLVRRQGLVPRFRRDTYMWTVAVWERST